MSIFFEEVCFTSLNKFSTKLKRHTKNPYYSQEFVSVEYIRILSQVFFSNCLGFESCRYLIKYLRNLNLLSYKYSLYLKKKDVKI